MQGARRGLARPGKKALAIMAACGINSGMNASHHRYYFWYYGFPMPLAEEGTRSS